MKKVKKVLIINPHGIGDVLFSTPIIRNLKEWDSSIRIYYMCNRRVEPLVKANPDIEKVFVYERDEFEKLKQKSRWQSFVSFWKFIFAIRKENIDMCLDLSLNIKFGIYALLSGINKRVGLNYKNRGRFLTHKISIKGYNDKHVIEYYLDVLRRVDIPLEKKEMELFLSQDDILFAKEKMSSFSTETKNNIIGIVPFGGAAFGGDANRKRWPVNYYAEVIKYLLDNNENKIVLFIGPSEKKELSVLKELVGESDRIIDTCGLKLMQSAALMKYCSLVISNDTGLVRFANALDKNIILFLGPVDNVVYGMYPPKDKYKTFLFDIECRPCYKNFRLKTCEHENMCLTGIKPDMVAPVILDFLQQQK